MTTLHRLTTQGTAELTEEFAKDPNSVSKGTFEDLSEPISGDYDVDLEPVFEAIQAVKDDGIEEFNNEMDSKIAPVLHEQLSIPRRVATDTRMWHRLAAVELREYVKYRWDPDGAILEKYRGRAGDLDSNAIARLWWIAELTHVPPDSDLAPLIDVEDEYELTRVALDYRYLSNRILDNRFHKAKPIVVATVDEFRDSPSEVVNDMPDRIKTALSLMPAEGWVEDNPGTFVSNVKDRMESED
ncbi:hypothetical protein HSB1_38650 [Halogranum salarium B-1]|uniref:Uncharacterized protein n=2 Tax=Halogranum rubrum TaxID=553466 RepID=J2ZAV0_9EURY|nr:hypothetical protein HSB1_38650 [Halogranum salarium B-1]